MRKQRRLLQADGRDPSNARVSVEDWKGLAADKGIATDRRRFHDYRTRLEERKLVHIDGPYVYLTERGEEQIFG